MQLQLNDFLEAEFELIKELFTIAHYGNMILIKGISICDNFQIFVDSSNAISLNDALEECLSRLYIDLIENPNINDLKYIDTITDNMPSKLKINK